MKASTALFASILSICLAGCATTVNETNAEPWVGADIKSLIQSLGEPTQESEKDNGKVIYTWISPQTAGGSITHETFTVVNGTVISRSVGETYSCWPEQGSLQANQSL